MTTNADWAAKEQEIAADKSNVPFNVEIPRSLKRELALQKVISGMTLRDIATAALTDYLRKQNGGK
ncbi:hypothetical protein [Rothia nasimurium]|uniref:hypothetical protein n=1 Tax=Rothia nasimurium TaxID=85336 RepID=UPI003BA28EE2